jgi:hypothetical protein
MTDLRERIIARLVEAVKTGEHCGTSDTGPRRIAAISVGGFGLLSKHKLWRDAMLGVSKVETPHPRAQQRFLDAWTRVPWGYFVRDQMGDDDIYFAALRKLLPLYEGPPVTLYRGQLGREPVGASWTRSFKIATKFALYGAENVDPDNLYRAKFPPRTGAVLLVAKDLKSEIISAPCLHGEAEGEYVVDPRGLNYSVGIDWDEVDKDMRELKIKIGTNEGLR